LLVAAAEPLGEPVLVRRAAARLGIGVEAAAPAQAAGLVEFGARVHFRHPLVRSAVYRAASLEDQRSAHRVLAEVTDPEVDPDRRAWHRAQAAAGPDEDVAGELERSAGRAQARGGLAAAAAFLERATALTIDPTRRAERALAAAQAKHQSGAADAALELLAIAGGGPLDELRSARVDLLRAQIEFAVHRGSDAPLLFLEAARRLEPLDLTLARETYLDALWSAWWVGRTASGGDALKVAEAVRAAPPPSQPARPADLLLDGLAVLITDGYPAGAPMVKRALAAFSSEDLSRDAGIRWLGLAGRAAIHMWDDESWYVLSARLVELARDAGALSVLPVALNLRAGIQILAGEFAAAALLNDEAKAVTDATGSQLAPYGAVLVAAYRGRETETSDLIQAATTEVVARSEGLGLTIVHRARAVLYNGLGRYEDALTEAQHAAPPEELLWSNWALPELIEAAARSGDTERAADALRRLSETTRASGTDWALGIEARSRALLSDGEAADALHLEAIDRLGRTRFRVELARAHLLYGEWLRRERRRVEAREQLRTAYDTFAALGMDAFARRARRELRATGETARKRTVQASGRLTPQETQIARLARDGLSNPEIGAHLFISPRTVEYHLRKVFAKLEISSRHELEPALSSDPNAVQPP
jgi:DNA-binding CsgD family transcriptional regulator